MASLLDAGRSFGLPAGVLINGRGGRVATNPSMFTWEAAKTYRLRICNVSIKLSLNFRNQGHDMKLLQIDGSHTLQDSYDHRIGSGRGRGPRGGDGDELNIGALEPQAYGEIWSCDGRRRAERRSRIAGAREDGKG
ncbi:hypothetical protein ZWY2020_020325 [Hordeum vulgare]|nr:hypothetical protein ZWY2020_020325 [Hordeum vulgare]